MVNPSDPLAADVTVKRPWTAFPLYLAGQIGMIASPTWLKASDNDDALKAKPVGTGPFIFESYAPNESFKAKRNPNYWNKPYPYLDEIEFRPIADALNRRDALKSGAVQMIHTTNGQTIADARDSKDFVLDERTYKGATSYTLLHVTQVLPDGTLAAHRPAGPLRAGQRLRRQTIIDTIDAGVDPIANGPFSPEQVGYLKDTGYPQQQDMEKAKALIADYKKEHPGPAQPVPGHDAGRHQPDHRPVPEAVVGGGRRRLGDHRPDRPGQLHRHRAARQLPDLPVAQPQRCRPRPAVHLVALLHRRSPWASWP